MFVYFCDDIYDNDSSRSSIIAPAPLQASVDETSPPPFKGYGGYDRTFALASEG